MAAEDRAAWTRVAYRTVADLSAAEFSEGCERARQTCRFPSEIVPTICGNIPDSKKASRYISATGHVYYGDQDDVIRESAKRSDWDIHWQAQAAKSRGLN